jgi:DNA-directed RNA polymerase specialized sigma24 family protein
LSLYSAMHNRFLLLEWRQRWNRNLFQFLRRRVRASVDVQDLAQETYLRLLRADLNEVRNPLAYLLQVASHVALEWCDRELSKNSSGILQVAAR